MVDLYADLVRRGLWPLESVPALWRDAVSAAIGGEVV